MRGFGAPPIVDCQQALNFHQICWPNVSLSSSSRPRGRMGESVSECIPLRGATRVLPSQVVPSPMRRGSAREDDMDPIDYSLARWGPLCQIQGPVRYFIL